MNVEEISELASWGSEGAGQLGADSNPGHGLMREFECLPWGERLGSWNQLLWP